MKATKKTFIMFLVVVLLAVSMPVNGLETVNAAEAAHLIINQVYGGGGKSIQEVYDYEWTDDII